MYITNTSGSTCVAMRKRARSAVLDAVDNEVTGARVGKNGLKANQKLKVAIETQKMLVLCEAVMKSALMRRESRGAHYRTDFPETSERFRVNIVSSRTASGGVRLSTRRVPGIGGALKREVERLEETPVHRSFE